MRGLQLFLKDWLHIIKHKQARIAVAILLMIPLLYAGMFLLGYWDPYGRLDQLPVAVVNLDKGAAMEGKPIHIGADLVNNLDNNKTLDFHFVTSDDAEKGLEQGQYYILIRIPEDFSQKVTTLTSANPEAANLIYKTNPGHNFIAGQIGASAVDKLKDEVGNEITKSYTQTVFDSLGQMADGLAKAGNGATQISDGTKKANEGFHSVQEGIDHMANGAAKLASGMQPLTDGQGQLAEGMLQLKQGGESLSSGMDQLTAAHQQLEKGAINLVQGTAGLSSEADQAGQAVSQMQGDIQALSDQLQTFMHNHPDLQIDQELQTMMQTADGLSKQAQAVQSSHAQENEALKGVLAGGTQLAGGLNHYGTKLSQAAEGSRQLATGANRLTDGMSKWQGGFQEFGGGVKALADGGRQLQQGTEPLANGMIQLVDGSGELSKSLTDAAAKSSGIHSSDSMVNMFSRPVQLVENKISSVANYGTAMTPYFLTLGLFVGGLIAANIIHFTRKPTIPGVTGWSHFINKFSLFLSIAVIQTCIVDAVILFGFGIHVFSVPKFLLLSLAASFTYATCIFMLVTLLGSLGRLAAIFLLVTQLASSGGTFPLQMASPFIQYISKCLPMTYAVQGFRSIISTGDLNEYWHNTLALLWYMVAFVIVALSLILASNEKHADKQPVQPSQAAAS